MPLYVADYLGDTRHLTTEQHGAYLLLLMTLWRSGGRLPNDPKKLARITGCNGSRWSRISEDVLEFFEVDGGEILNRRLMLELEKATEKSNQRALAGSLGGKATALKNNNPEPANAQQLARHSSESDIREKERKDIVVSVPEPTRVFEVLVDEPEQGHDHPARPKPWEGDEAFAAFWSASTDQGRKRTSRALVWPEWRRALKSASGPDLAAAMVRYVAGDEDAKRTGGPGLHLWLKAGRYEHWLTGAADPAALPAATFNGPALLRASVVELLGEAFARTWIDPCRWDAAERTLVARNAFGAAKLNDELGAWMRKTNVRAQAEGQGGEPV